CGATAVLSAAPLHSDVPAHSSPSSPPRRSSDLPVRPALQARPAPAGGPGVRAGSVAPVLDQHRLLVHAVHLTQHVHLLAERAERSEEHTSKLQSRENLVCRLLLEKKKTIKTAAR